MNFLCFASATQATATATATFLWNFLLPYRLNIDTDRPKKRQRAKGRKRGRGGRLQEKLRFRGRVTSLASFEKTRDARVFLCFSISAKYWKLFILIAFDASPPSTSPLSLSSHLSACCVLVSAASRCHSHMNDTIHIEEERHAHSHAHRQMYWLISRLLLLTFMASDINLCLCWHLVSPPSPLFPSCASSLYGPSIHKCL